MNSFRSTAIMLESRESPTWDNHPGVAIESGVRAGAAA